MSDLTIVIEAARKWAAHKEAGGYGAEADAITAAIYALETEGGRSPDPSPVSYDPCITGTIDIEGRASEFMLLLDRGDVGYSQWGADNPVLWQRTDLLEGMSVSAKEWWLDNKPEDGDEDA